jgi:SAM-dependent methyltransferase
LSLWADAYATGTYDFPPQARVLEVGCAEADWITPMLALRPDLVITGIDWRKCTRPGTVIQGDVLTQEFPDASFDVMVGVSSMEHIGLGHYDQDPLDVDGDVHAMARVVRWLKLGGWVYLDVPYEPAGYRVEGTSHRVYDDAALQARLLPGLTIRQRWLSTTEVSCVSVVATKDGP